MAVWKKGLRYRLKLKTLDFVSAVDSPAQETAKVVLIKDASGGIGLSAKFKILKLEGALAKLADELGIVFGFAFTSQADGADYFDLQGDNVLSDMDMLKAAIEFAAKGGPSDEMHDGVQTGWTPFLMPLTPDVAKAFGIETDTFGLMVGVKPSDEVYAKYKSGEYKAFSIQATGIRLPVEDDADKRHKAYTYYAMGDRVRVIRGKEHDEGHAGRRGTISETEDGAFGVRFDGEEKAHRWYTGSELAPLDADELEDDDEDESSDKRHVPLTPTVTSKGDPTMADSVKKTADQLQAENTVLTAKVAELEGKLERAEKRDELDPVVYISPTDGSVFRKSDDERVWKAVKRADEAERRDEVREFQKRGVDLFPALKLTDAQKGMLLEAIEKGTPIADKADREAIAGALKGANAAMKRFLKTDGQDRPDVDDIDGDDGDEDPIAKWDGVVAKYASEKGVKIAKATKECIKLHASLYDQVSAARRMANVRH